MRVRLLGVLLLVAAIAPLRVATPASAVVLDRPVPGAVLAVFDAPTRYGPGHRGVDLAAPVDSPVRAAAGGRVTFAGRVVGTTWVTVDHGVLRTTVGPLQTVSVDLGQVVTRGQVVGTSGRAHDRSAVHWSARRGDVYVDPLGAGRTLGTLVPEPSPSRAAPPWPGTRVR